ncbi:MAG: hypothetical protein ACKOPM_08215 [Novosphingobium sp.]
MTRIWSRLIAAAILMLVAIIGIVWLTVRLPQPLPMQDGEVLAYTLA